MNEYRDGHLDPADVSAYIDRVVEGGARHRIEAHLASCPECRAELMDATRIVATLPRAREMRGRVWIPAVAAAAVVLLVVWPQTVREPTVQVAHREGPVTATVAPRPVAPVGAIDSVTALVWSPVPYTDRYRVRVFDARGTVIWERETTDTTIRVPVTEPLRPGQAYFWKVEAQAGFGRSTSTDLIEFSVRHSRQP